MLMMRVIDSDKDMHKLAQWIPPVAARGVRNLLGQAMWYEHARGGWEDALAVSSGYDGDAILQKVLAATRAVRAGKAAYERDGALFLERAVAFQLVAPLLRHALKHDGRLEVVDFGGSLGSTFHQLRWFLPPLRSFGWRVVEQPHFVEAGRAEFQTDELSFHACIEDLPSVSVPRLMLLSSVLQYLPLPHEILASLSSIGASTMVIDRTPFADSLQDQVCIQHVPASLYKASYPCWIFSRQDFDRRCAAAGWAEILRFTSAEGECKIRGGAPFRFEGRILEAQP